MQLTCMVSCLFARNVYSEERLQECLTAVGLPGLAEAVVARSRDVQADRWRLKFLTGYNPEKISIPKRFGEVTTWKGAMDAGFMNAVALGYRDAARNLAHAGQNVQNY